VGCRPDIPLFKEHISIFSCKRDVTVQLKRLNFSSSSVSSESELILLRSGHFDEQGDGMPKALYDQSTGTFLGYLGTLLVSVHIHSLRGFRKGKCDTGVSKKIVSR